jgi:hypothetical protein
MLKHMALKLSIEEREALAELIDQPGWPVFVAKILPDIMDEQASRVLDLQGDSSYVAHMLLTEQSRFQGMRLMLKKVVGIKEILMRGNTRSPNVK